MTYNEVINLRNTLSDKEKQPIIPESRYMIVITPESQEDFTNYYKELYQYFIHTDSNGDDLDSLALDYCTNNKYLLRRVTMNAFNMLIIHTFF